MTGQQALSRFRLRLLLLALATALPVLAISARLSYLTIGARDSLRERAELQHQHTLKLEARRGTIRDRNGRELATSVSAESVYSVPKAFEGERIEVAARELARCLGIGWRRVATRLEGEKSFAWLVRKASPASVACVRSLNLPGVGFLAESRRFYPKRQLASQVLGYVGIDNEGMSGVEYALEETVRGEPGRRIIWTDARNRRASSRIDERPVAGRSVYLTLDENLQYIAETELREAIRETGSKSGIAILMRPSTGELLAMAAFPSFNPNRYGNYPESHWRNRSVTDVYEPGSTFKIVAAAAALEEGVTSEEERIDCGNGAIRIGERVIRDHSVFDVLTFSEVVEKSSNVGMIRVGQRLGKERLEAYIRAFGFGDVTDVELPAESRGILRSSKRWGPVTLASISFGQEIGVTPLQMVTAANAIATRGYLMKPRLVLGYEAGGRLLETMAPEPVRRVVTEETARRLTEILVRAVEGGTGQAAAIDGYRVAGKTGTAQKAVLGGYSETDYVASFVGFVPARRPEITALVILDSPSGDHSGARAGWVFRRIARRSLHYLGVPPQEGPTVRIAKVWPQSRPILEEKGGHGPAAVPPSRGGFFALSDTLGSPAPGGSVVAASASAVGPGRVGGESGVPNVIGLPARDALVRFVAKGLIPEIRGSGRVVAQEPPPGAPLETRRNPRLVLSGRGAFGSENTDAPLETSHGVRIARASWLTREPAGASQVRWLGNNE